MNVAENDLLLKFGKAIALLLQGLCALVATGFVLFVLVVALLTQGMLTEVLAPDGLPISIAASPPTFVSICLVVAANLTMMFFFFGKMRALIESVRTGDPFIPQNAQRLNAMAWLLLGAKVLAEIVGWLRLYLASLIDKGGANTFDFNLYDLHSFLIVLVLFILARVFRHGAAMREDLEGTV
jgi:hypothetical protein